MSEARFNPDERFVLDADPQDVLRTLLDSDDEPEPDEPEVLPDS